MLPADDWLDWKNLLICNITSAMADSYLADQEFPRF
jgi:hypothetical protein